MYDCALNIGMSHLHVYKKSNILTALILNRHMKNTLGFKMMRALDSKLQQKDI